MLELTHFLTPLERNWSFIDHLSHVLPTEKIFELLESFHSESLICYFSEDVKNMHQLLLRLCMSLYYGISREGWR